jgi:large subunit ribosomal protein L18e
VKRPKTTNPQRIELIRFLKKQGRENKAHIWRDIAERLAKPRSRSVVVNLSRLERHTEKSEIVVVPGKVLATGQIKHPITVAAFAYSAKAVEKILTAKGKCVSFADLIKKNPTGANVKILG